MNKLLSQYSRRVLHLPRPVKRLVVILVDTCLCVLSVWLAFYLRLGEFISLGVNERLAVAVAVIMALPLFIVSGLYLAVFRYSGWAALMAVVRSVGAYGVLYATVFTIIGVPGVPRTIGIIQPILLLLLVGSSRAFARLWLGEEYRGVLKLSLRPKALIYGAGESGRQLAIAIANSPKVEIVGFLDDDQQLYGNVINQLRVYRPADIKTLVRSLGVRHIFLAMPSISQKRRNEILDFISSAHVTVRTLPSINDLVRGRLSDGDLRDLDIDDLLGREPVEPDCALLSMCIKSKIVMVTGAGGSIGSELCRQVISCGAAKLLLVEQNEFSLYAIHQELGAIANQEVVLIPLLASVRDEDRIRKIMLTWRPEIIYHAAAYKHVPLVEHNPVAGIENNVFGTLRTAQLAVEHGVDDFVLISTDKAVRPTNFMGASKRLAEMSLQALAALNVGTKFSIVRFGNVLGSSGSVVPMFREQIRNGGPITLTHIDVTRYFMTIPEAAQLVIQAGAMANCGDIFLLDMGRPVKIIDLARRMIQLSGATVKDDTNPDGEIEIEVIGLRPGEKLYEELLIGDNPQPTSHPRIMKAHESFIPWPDLQIRLRALEKDVLTSNDVPVIRRMMSELVSGYTPSEEIVDWIYAEQELQAQA